MTSTNAHKLTFIVFGATGGIGTALSRRLAQLRSKVIISGQNRDKLNALAIELAAQSKLADATDYKQVENAVMETISVYGKIDGIINCAGSVLVKPLHAISDNEWSETVAKNLTTSFNILKAGTKAMSKTGGGSIVLMASAAASIGLPHHEAISAVKSGIIGMTRSAAASFAKNNVRCNCVAPGLTATPATAKFTSNPKSMDYSLSLHPLGRIGAMEDIVSSIMYLLDPESQWITGQVFNVDGGLSTLKS